MRDTFNHKFKNLLKMGMLGLVFFLGIQNATAQFTVREDFKGNTAPDFVLGDGAYLTAGGVDPANAGWLRLTEAKNNDYGYAYINKSFPTSMGVLIEFDYTMWRDAQDGTYNGGDGLSVFLFDGTIDTITFRLGGYGGSLGYAPNINQDPPVTLGLSGGYLGIGFDAYGNFSNPTEGRNGGQGVKPNSIVLRGPTTANVNTSNEYLKGVQLGTGDRTEDMLDYNPETPTRPTSSEFYRRVQIEIMPTSSGEYKVIVRWKKDKNDPFTEKLSYTMSTAPPKTLKVGFAASTGGAFNYHEIRNLYVTTPGNLRIAKTADKNVLRTFSDGINANKVTYTIEVTNATPVALTGVQFRDTLTDGNGDVIPEVAPDPKEDPPFNIKKITTTGFSTGTKIDEDPSGNSISGTLTMAANTTGTITVTGILNAIPAGNNLINTATITPTVISDKDMSNNTSTVKIPVSGEGIDLVIDQTVDTPCLDTNGNIFTLTVSNIGTNRLKYSNGQELVVTETIPSGASLNVIDATGWTFDSSNPGIFTKDGSDWVDPNESLPSITIELTGLTSGYTNTIKVESKKMEPSLNWDNNESSVTIEPTPAAPVVSSPVYYCFGEMAKPLTATPNSNNELLWYLSKGSVSQNIPFTPVTSASGTTIYYVTQKTPGGCESTYSEIKVIVLPETTAGSVIGDQVTCKGTAPQVLSSAAPGSGAGKISYEWQSSIDGGNTWITISGATQPAYQPEKLYKTTHFRRKTVSTDSSTATCSSSFTNTIIVTVEKCKVISNPVLPSRAINK